MRKIPDIVNYDDIKLVLLMEIHNRLAELAGNRRKCKTSRFKWFFTGEGKIQFYFKEAK